MRNRIKELRKKLNLTQAQLAEKVDKSALTVQRVETGFAGLSDKKAEIYAKALGVTAAEIFSAETTARTVQVRSHVQAGEWGDNPQWLEDDFYDVAIPNDSEIAPYPLYAAEARGPSMNTRYPEGTVVVFTHAIETAEDFIPGKRYIVERERADGLREATVKLLVKEENGTYWLYPESTDPRHQTPIELNGTEGDTIRIVGQVRYSVVRE